MKERRIRAATLIKIENNEADTTSFKLQLPVHRNPAGRHLQYTYI